MATKSIITQNPVRLEGYQAVFEPSKFGKCGLMCIVDQGIVDQLDDQRGELLDWCKSKVKNVRRSTLKPEPWEEVSQGQYQLKFRWDPEQPVPVVDSEGTPITQAVPLFSGALVKVAFRQRPYTLPDDSYGTSLKLQAIQVIKASNSAGVDSGDLDEAEAAAMFGQSEGFKVGDPNVEVAPDKEEDEDF